MKANLFIAAGILSALLFSGCSFFSSDEMKDCNKPYIDIPLELQDYSRLSAFIESARPQFRGKKIFLDPGHGGEDRRNKGKNKIVIEADINLFTALALRDFLTAAGAEVIMSRSIDKSVGLEFRSEMANASCADLFISIHHNAPGANSDAYINYTSTYYHALETDYEYEPMERDMARYIQRDLSYAMRHSGGLGSFDGTYSDYSIYPKLGFSVLRRTEIPSILVECSFFSHAYEEKKLAQKEYNRIEAFGIFRGLSRYLKNGYPKISTVNSVCNDKSVSLSFNVEDSIKIVKNSIKVFVNQKPFPEYSFSDGKLTIKAPYTYNGPLTVKILLQNERNNYSAPFEQKFNFILPSKE